MKRAMEYNQLEIRIHELEKVMKKEKNRRLYERYQAIMLHLKGYTNIKIAEIGQIERVDDEMKIAKYAGLYW